MVRKNIATLSLVAKGGPAPLALSSSLNQAISEITYGVEVRK
jgi:hypothetical protein